MHNPNINQTSLDNYYALLENLSHDEKLTLIAWFSQSLMSHQSKEAPVTPGLGAFESEQSAEELIAEIRGSRLFNREREIF